jgi:hypothetical protein
MGKFIVAVLLVVSSCALYAQDKKVKWEEVQVFEFRKDIPDSLEICGGEWFIEGNANTLMELDNLELERIKTKIAEHGCAIVYVDVRKVYDPRKGQLYILGLRRKTN